MTLGFENASLLLATPLDNFTVSKDGVFNSVGQEIGEFIDRVMICESMVADASEPAILVMSSSVEFLFGTKRQESQWMAFLNKYHYAMMHHKRFLLWLGNLVNATPDLLVPRSPDAPPCDVEAAASVERWGPVWLKPLAIHSVMQLKGHISWLFFMDLDAWFTKNNFEQDFLPGFLDTDADVVASQDWYRVFINTAMLGFRNTSFTRGFLSQWLANRCVNDQLSIWNTFFIQFEKEDPSFKWYRDNPMASIYAKYLHSQQLTKWDVEPLEHHYPKAIKAYLASSVLSRRLRFPHLDLYPNTGPTALRCRRKLPPSAEEVVEPEGPAPYICHRKCAPGGAPRVGAVDVCGCSFEEACGEAAAARLGLADRRPNFEAWFINVKTAPERKRCMGTQFERMGVELHRYEAEVVEGCDDTDNLTACMVRQGFEDCVKGGIDWDAVGHHSNTTKGTLDLAIRIISDVCNHKRLYAKVSESTSPAEFVIVFEDDVYINYTTFVPKLNDFLGAYRDKTWDMVMIDPFTSQLDWAHNKTDVGGRCDEYKAAAQGGAPVLRVPQEHAESPTGDCKWRDCNLCGGQAILLRRSSLTKLVTIMESTPVVPLDRSASVATPCATTGTTESGPGCSLGTLSS